MASNNIPLLCTICPKKPNFSDVSHLLTHIASKGHLSHYYKVKVRSTHEDASRHVIDTYDRWYAEWNVEELMSDRMNQKDKRRTRARPAAAHSTSASRIEAPIPRSTRSAAVGGLLDPRLSEQQVIKVESDSATPTPIPQPGHMLRHRTFAHHLQYWPVESHASSRSFTNPDYETSSEYSDPSERPRRHYQYAADDTCAIEDETAEAADDTMAVSESTKLKGVYWPGMDIFDSATPEMRRKRNQKKDHSVVEQLELNSQDVEATELIFTPHGSFKRQRRISSSIFDDEEDVEIKTESPRSTMSRPALASMDPNIARRARPGSRAPMFAFQTRGQYEDIPGHLGFESDIGNRAPKRKRALHVFQDDETSFAQPANFNYLTSSFGGQASPSLLPPFGSYKPFNDPFQHDNKENIFSTIQHSAYGNLHGRQMPGLYYHAYTYGLGQDQQGLEHVPQLFSANSAYQPQLQRADDDDQRTITAPPSPATS
ncbi:hypothetical protein SVAN01_10016 [Stagonosporopsis vannaccii]|nr:hypothetical protein SVAN01_10016 [Stagonosporopsis vannaccii]